LPRRCPRQRLRHPQRTGLPEWNVRLPSRFITKCGGGEMKPTEHPECVTSQGDRMASPELQAVLADALRRITPATGPSGDEDAAIIGSARLLIRRSSPPVPDLKAAIKGLLNLIDE